MVQCGTSSRRSWPRPTGQPRCQERPVIRRRSSGKAGRRCRRRRGCSCAGCRWRRRRCSDRRPCRPRGRRGAARRAGRRRSAPASIVTRATPPRTTLDPTAGSRSTSRPCDLVPLGAGAAEHAQPVLAVAEPGVDHDLFEAAAARRRRSIPGLPGRRRRSDRRDPVHGRGGARRAIDVDLRRRRRRAASRPRHGRSRRWRRLPRPSTAGGRGGCGTEEVEGRGGPAATAAAATQAPRRRVLGSPCGWYARLPPHQPQRRAVGEGDLARSARTRNGGSRGGSTRGWSRGRRACPRRHSGRARAPAGSSRGPGADARGRSTAPRGTSAARSGWCASISDSIREPAAGARKPDAGEHRGGLERAPRGAGASARRAGSTAPPPTAPGVVHASPRGT